MNIPSSTYRVQLNQQFSFEELKGIVSYIHDLGISAIYAAPIGSATPGSTHGYDVTDPNLINPEVGSRKDMQELYQLLREKEMIWIQDIVPNHMAFSPHNLRLMDVLERGPVSPYYRYFDIDWDHDNPMLKGKVMVPFLGKEVEQCVREREIRMALNDSGITVRYYDDDYPVSEAAIFLLKEHCGSQNTLAQSLNDLMPAYASKVSVDEWIQRKKEWVKELHRSGSDMELIEVLDRVSNDPDLMLSVLSLQHYRLTYWKITEKEINYRRFFTVNSLICLRMGDQEVFDEYHQMIAKLYRDGLVQGVRIDHIDGLNDPTEYLLRLRRLLGNDCYIVAEKILESEEMLPESWPIQGTSGYEFLSNLNKLLTDPRGSEKLVTFYRSLVPEMPGYEELVERNKRLILQDHMAGELDNLVSYFRNADLLGDFESDRIRKALAAFMLALPVYRIYPGELPLSGFDLTLIEGAFKKAIKNEPGCSEELHYLRWLCIAEITDEKIRSSFLRFLKRLMQFTGPLTAKGVEDTTFYIYNPLISHDEVGDDPSVLGTSIRDFHKKMILRASMQPLSLNASATHDTKRGEDARVRLNVLSEIPETWIEKVEEWMAINQVHKQSLNGMMVPETNDEYFLYQSILGGYQEDLVMSEEWKRRLKEYMIKALREAKVSTNWESPNLQYENACISFVDRILADDSKFLPSFIPFLSEVVSVASVYSVVQSVIKITAPGIPDVYQGCELWDFSYVDPDNRRPVDYERRILFLNELKHAFKLGFDQVAAVLEKRKQSGIQKLYAIWRSLNFRKDNSDIFIHGAYLPLTQVGEGGRAMGYARYFGDQWCIVAVPVLLARKNVGDSEDLDRNFISLPVNSPKTWRNIFTNVMIDVSETGFPIAKLFSDFPVAVLVNT